MFLSERIHIIDRINEVKGMLLILNLYLEGTYEDSKATTSIISSAKDELNEALLTAKGLMKAIIVDIDGTIADNTHRQHFMNLQPKNWNEFFIECHKDEPIVPVIEMIQKLCRKYKILVVTGRPEKYRQLTNFWLIKHKVPCDNLYMRKCGDYRPDHEIKLDILDIIRREHDILLAIDDRQSVVDMWRRNGILCLQNEDRINACRG